MQRRVAPLSRERDACTVKRLADEFSNLLSYVRVEARSLISRDTVKAAGSYSDSCCLVGGSSTVKHLDEAVLAERAGHTMATERAPTKCVQNIRTYYLPHGQVGRRRQKQDLKKRLRARNFKAAV